MSADGDVFHLVKKMQMYLYMYISKHIYIYKHTYVLKYIYIYTSIHTYIHTCIYVYLHSIYMYTHTYIYIYIYIYISTYLPLSLSLSLSIFTNKCMCICAFMNKSNVHSWINPFYTFIYHPTSKSTHWNMSMYIYKYIVWCLWMYLYALWIFPSPPSTGICGMTHSSFTSLILTHSEAFVCDIFSVAPSQTAHTAFLVRE